jgi:hypothetical protein
MSAIEIVTIVVGRYNGKDVHAPTGWKGRTFSKIHDWIDEKERLGTNVSDISASVLVKGMSHWAAYAEKIGHDTLVTIFEVVPDGS